MNAPTWLLDAINATKSERVPTVPDNGSAFWVQSSKPESPANKGFPSVVPTVPSVPGEKHPDNEKTETQDTSFERERRRKKVLSLLEKGKRFALYVDDDTTDPVIATVGIQNTATFELEIPRHSYDGMVLLELIQKHYEADKS